MDKKKDRNSNSGATITTEDGTQYFIMGNTRIKVTEHFKEDGKSLSSLLEDMIRRAAATTF